MLSNVFVKINILSIVPHTSLHLKTLGFLEMFIGTKFEMSFTRSTASNPNIIPKVDEPECLMRRIGVPNGLSYHTIRASKKVLAQEAAIMDT